MVPEVYLSTYMPVYELIMTYYWLLHRATFEAYYIQKLLVKQKLQPSRESNPGPFTCESFALTTRPWYQMLQKILFTAVYYNIEVVMGYSLHIKLTNFY